MGPMALNVSYGVAALLGIVAAVFGILTLLAVTPAVLAPAGVIALGLSELMPEEMFGQIPRRDYWLVRGGLGLVAIVLAIFALLGTASPLLLIGLGIIAVGVGLFVPLGTQAGGRGRLEWGLRAFTGLAAIILAIVALAGTAPLTLFAVAIIIVGVSIAAP